MYAKTKKPPASATTSTVRRWLCSEFDRLEVPLAAASLLLLLLLLLVPVLFVRLALRCK